MLEAAFATLEPVFTAIEKIDEVGLKEAWFSVEHERVSDLQKVLEALGYTVTLKHWNHPQSLYIGSGVPASTDLSVFSVRW
jgi:hypothetical protein